MRILPLRRVRRGWLRNFRIHQAAVPWWSGLRIGEALELHWTDDYLLCVDFEGRRPMFRIRGEAHKSGKDCILPMAPEFAELLETVPVDERQGYVFSPQPIRHNGRGTGRIRLDTVSKIVARIGKQAILKVAQNKAGKVKFASAHDLRRAFGFRWSMRVMPAILQQLSAPAPTCVASELATAPGQPRNLLLPDRRTASLFG